MPSPIPTPFRRPAPLPVLALALLAGCHASDGNGTTADEPATVAAVTEGAPDIGGEGYAHLADNRFTDPTVQPLSTFAIDVDAASYANVRRMLEDGHLPPAGAVRIEELVNYFTYDYPDPAGDAPFAVVTEVGPAPWNPAHRLVHIGIQGRRMQAETIPPNNLVFLVDVSGSMSSPDKLPLLKRGLELLVQRLRPEDRVAIVTYAGGAHVALPPTPGSEKDRILAVLERLEAGGGTAGDAGIELAYRLARQTFLQGGNNRVILATDGDFNVGASSEDALVSRIERERQGGVALTVLGFGTGNLQDAKMELLADRGNGNYAYVDGMAEAQRVLVEEMSGTLVTLARDVKVQVEFNPAHVRSYRLIGYENRLLAAADFNDDARDAGELGAGHSVTALYEIVPVDAPTPSARRVDPLRYQSSRTAPDAARGGELLTVKLRWQPPLGGTSALLERAVRDERRALDATSDDFRFSAAVAAWGMVLRDSPHRGNSTHALVTELATGARGRDDGGWRAGFLRLVSTSQRLASSGSIEDVMLDVGER